MNETRLHKDLFDGYNKDSHPRFPGTGPVTVAFDFQLIRILDVVSPFWSIACAVVHLAWKPVRTDFVVCITECKISIHKNIRLGKSGKS